MTTGEKIDEVLGKLNDVSVRELRHLSAYRLSVASCRTASDVYKIEEMSNEGSAITREITGLVEEYCALLEKYRVENDAQKHKELVKKHYELMAEFCDTTRAQAAEGLRWLKDETKALISRLAIEWEPECGAEEWDTDIDVDALIKEVEALG